MPGVLDAPSESEWHGLWQERRRVVDGSPGACGDARRAMRIAFIVNNYPPRVGGVELHVRNLARGLIAQGHRVLVVTLSDRPGRADDDGIDVVRLREHFRIGDILGFPSAGATRRVARLLKELDIDVVSIHTRFFPMSWVGLRAARRASLPVIHTEHGSDHVVSPSPAIRIGSRAVDLTIGRFVLRQATEVIGVSENVIAFVRRLSGRTDARVFYNAIDAAPAKIDRSPRRHVVFVGRLVPGKGAEVFVQALAMLAADGVEFTAEILGDGVSADAIAASVVRAGLEGRVTLRGRVELAEVSRSLAGGVLVNPSTLAEGFQTTILEALEVGGSVVSYDLPGVRILREQGFAVDLVEQKNAEALADAIRLRLDSPWTVRPMEGWHWSTRASEYALLAADVRRRVAMVEN
ncbi:glycosyltransferase family 4 protein [Microbacterium sp. 69-10]|uniref:glycosyltransferase family 4 protein n=1 Tax=Microbacterium sp. 69-10 TaxID=1895783 RepID=UPI0025DBFDE0|nr:glycosyltransferase family 4 protein [Microbacterium sp. 69-10]